MTLPFKVCISIHALLAESDNRFTKRDVLDAIFLSTLSLRRATVQTLDYPNGAWNFYPRSPCGERQCRKAYAIIPVGISIHALLAESDLILFFVGYNVRGISIHALLAESDGPHSQKHINSRAFLSTLSLRRATLAPKQNPTQQRISIHALLAESDLGGISDKLIGSVFLSTLSLRRATGYQRPYGHPTTNFYPRSPCGERLNPASHTNLPGNFYPRSPCGERLYLVHGQHLN